MHPIGCSTVARAWWGLTHPSPKLPPMGAGGFRFVDLFAGIGGFHAALSAMGGRCVYAVEIDPRAASVYERNWGVNPLGDLTADATEHEVLVPRHDVLCAGFPCQPFSKSGAQRGMDETRGTLYWNILRVIQERRPAVVLLENVRNLAGPRHVHELQVIVETLREEGYRVSEMPAIFSPHLLPPDRGGRPQIRERVFITATRLPKARAAKHTADAEPAVANEPVSGWDPATWHLESDLPLDEHSVPGCDLSSAERTWIDAWDEFVRIMWEEREGRRLPGFPLWADHWRSPRDVSEESLQALPRWKSNYVLKNVNFYSAHRRMIDRWTKRWGVYTDAFPASRRKLEWQAQDTPTLWGTIIHLRPSGIRAKAPSYVPALVAITQTSIVGPRGRRITPREAARLQGFPDWFDFGDQPNAATYRQLGNGVSVGAVWHVLKRHVARDEDVLKRTAPQLVASVLDTPMSPDSLLGARGR